MGDSAGRDVGMIARFWRERAAVVVRVLDAAKLDLPLPLTAKFLAGPQLGMDAFLAAGPGLRFNLCFPCVLSLPLCLCCQAGPARL